MSSHVLPKKLLILALVLPFAVFLGFNLADPDSRSLELVVLFGAILSIPFVLKWHHPLLIFSWNLPMTIFFLPGNPSLWMLAGIISLGLSVLGTIMDKEQRLVHVPVMTWAMLALAVVVVFTMKMTGSGIGLRALGSSVQGGGKYFYILLAIIGYFGISCRPLPSAKSNKYIALFLLPESITSISNLIYYVGPSLWFLYYLFPVNMAMLQAVEEFGVDPYSLKMGRLAGFGVAGSAVFSFMLARFGVRGILDIRRPRRALMLLTVGTLGLFGGFRSTLIIYLLLFTFQFFLEGLHRTRMMPFLAVGGIVGALLVLPFTERLPLPIQRCLSILPVPVNPAVRANAEGSSEWRKQMWKAISPEIPRYLWVGKGYTASEADYYLTTQAVRLGLVEGFEGSVIAGDYHNGPLSVIIPFGVWGVLAFLFFVGASLHVLIQNYRYGDPASRRVNTFLLAFFLTRIVFFFGVFGAIHSDVPILAGLVAFSISLNGGLCRARVPVEAPKPAAALARVPPRRWMPARS